LEYFHGLLELLQSYDGSFKKGIIMSEKIKFADNIGNLAIFTILVASLIWGAWMLNDRTQEVKKLNVLVEMCKKDKEIFSLDEYEATNTNKLRDDIYTYIKTRYTRIPKEVASSIADNVMLFSKQYKTSPELLIGMMEVESRFNPMAVSSADARGLMQVMPEWIPKFNIENVNDLHDIDVGIESGIKVFNIHLGEAKGDVSKALYLYVGKNAEYAKEVYAFVGRFVTYRAKKRNGDGTNK
jgi:hypothetical protein